MLQVAEKGESTLVTSIFSNPAIYSMRALVLRVLDSIEWRHHGIGVLQGYLIQNSHPEIRLHIWSRKLLKPGMEESGDIHDHRFDMVSHVLCGSVEHEEVTFTSNPSGTYRMLELTHARAASDTNYHGPTRELEGSFKIDRQRMLIATGNSYRFPARHFHRSPLRGNADAVAVTVVQKHGQRDDIAARLLYPAAIPPVMAFGHEVDELLIAQVIMAARQELEKVCA